MNQKRILMIAYTFPPFFSEGGSIRVVKFLKYLCNLGWRPSLLTISDREELASQRRVGSEELLREIPHQAKIFRTKRSGELTLARFEQRRRSYEKGPLAPSFVTVLTKLRNALDKRLLLPDSKIRWLPYAISAARRIIRREQTEVLFVTCPPHSAAIIGAVLKIMTGLPLVIDYRDDWIDTPWFRSKSRVRQLIERRLERWVVRKADRVVAVTKWSRRAFMSRYRNEPPEKFVMVPNGCDLEEFRTLSRPVHSKPAAPFSIVYAGLLSPGEPWRREPVSFLQAISNLRKRNPAIRHNLQLIFTGQLNEPFPQMVRGLDLQDSVKEVGHLNRSQYVELLRSADLLLAINYDDFSTLIPGKIYEYWAAGVAPILLLSCKGAASDFIDEHALGSTVDSYDVEAIEREVEGAFLRYTAGRPLRINTAGIEAYDRKALARSLSNELSPLVRPQAELSN